jgi:uncharacterized YigZ family protein
LNSYRSIQCPAETEIVVKKSRFIAQAAPANTPEAADAFVAAVRAKHPEARHNVWCYQLRGGQKRYSDDGEPKGTAGIPVLGCLEHVAVLDCVLVVTRYFGGILLGAPGLLRAYSQAAAAVLRDAHVCTMARCRDFALMLPYDCYGRALQLIAAERAVVFESQFGEDVQLTVRTLAARADQLCDKLIDISNGKARIGKIDERFVPWMDCEVGS